MSVKLNETHYQIIKYIFVGGGVVTINVSLLYSLTEFLHFHYLVSALISFFVAFLFSFFLQKFFTFRDDSRNRVASQMARYLSLQIANLCANMTLLYALVEYLRIWYILAELVVALGLAVVTFLISRRFIFLENQDGLSATHRVN